MARGLLIIRTITPTHPGAGTSLGAIDLMLQREVTTDFPFIQGSSLKGAIRGYLEAQPIEDNVDVIDDLINRLEKHAVAQDDKNLKKEIDKVKKSNSSIKIPVFKAREFTQILIKAQEDEKKGKEIENRFSPLYAEYDKVFGPYNPRGGLEKGAIVISDASLLFYPVRSLRGLYALVTCPEILKRLTMPHIGLDIPDNLLKWDDKGKVRALNSAKSKYEINGKVYFEDLNFSVEILTEDDFSWIDKLGFENKLKEDIQNRLFIVQDDIFQYFVKFATMVISRNRIDYETGIVRRGALWTEEHLPPETYLFSYLEDSGDPIGKIKVEENGTELEKDITAFEWLKHKVDLEVIHLGGDETVGKGFVEMRFTALNTKSKEQLKSLTQEAKNG